MSTRDAVEEAVASAVLRRRRAVKAGLKISQGVPRAQVMQATGHRTESSFNRYLGVIEQELVETFRKTARAVA